MVDMMKAFLKDEEGQDLVEYALLLVFLALAAIAILPTLGST
jgi:Flp pilus assembly pilin Flp